MPFAAAEVQDPHGRGVAIADDRLGDGTSVSFYSKAGLESAKKHLAPNGILGVWSYAPSSPYTDSLHSVFPNVRVEPITHENRLINEKHPDWLFFTQN